ncbi:uncharacterized protein LOC113870904 [Abrus precatorius]|uniref:Uncharacterized protein LOC113870904 n=1 Tax=Abrus precatorius TaxID=3816 RepID=A0A8B8M5J6_ABRPR|nr:uncharacterized protein LOC113870904 [Abrus precatorius]
MGNCLVLQENMVRIVKSDGKVLEYKTPIKVHHVLKQFSGHAICDSLPLQHHLHPNTRLLNGQLYYLVPLPRPSPKASKKKVSFAEPEVQGGVIRVKLVISKQELKEIQGKGGISVNELLSLVQREKGMDVVDVCEKYHHRSQGWKPTLDTIPELTA